MNELIPLADLERRSQVPRENETPTEYVSKVLREVDVDEETAETVVEAYQYGLFAADPTFEPEQVEAIHRFEAALPDESEPSATAEAGEPTETMGSVETTEASEAGDTTDAGAADGTEIAETDPAVASGAETVGETADESESVTTNTNGGAADHHRTNRTQPDRDRSEQDESDPNRTGGFAVGSVVTSLSNWRPNSDVQTARLGTWLVVVSVLAFAVSIVGGAALTPSIQEGGTNAGVGDDGPQNATLVGLQAGGKVVEYGPQGDRIAATDNIGNGGSYFGVSKLENGSVLAAYMRGGYEECGPYEPKCYRTGFRTLNFQNGSTDVQSEWSYPIRTAHSSEVHDVELLPSGNVLVAGMEHERVFIVNRSTGNVTWQWNASSFYDAPDDPTQEDWLHINDVDRIGEGRYMVSVRNAFQIVIVERGKGVVEVINEERNPDLFKAQHNPQYLGPNAILIADSENDRVIEIHRKDGEWEIVWEVKSVDGIELDWPRDADRLPNGNTLITDTHNDRVVEVNRAGEVVWSVKTGRLPYEADRLPGEYPAGEPYRFDDGRRSIGTASVDLPVFGYLLASLRHVAPVPYWVTDWHLLVFTLSLVGTMVGSVLRWRGS